MDIAALTDDLAKLDGLPPHDGPSNPCLGDGYFMVSIQRKYGKPIEALREIRDREVGVPTKTFEYKKG